MNIKGTQANEVPLGIKFYFMTTFFKGIGTNIVKLYALVLFS